MTTHFPRITVLTPAYNHARYLTQCIESVTLQSRPPDEFLILDDASTDTTPDVVEHYARQFPFIRHWRHEQNQGAGRTVRNLFEASTGDFVLGVAADDALLPGFLETASAIASQHPEVGLILGRHVNVPEDWDYLKGLPPEATAPCWKASGLLTPSQFLRATLMDSNGLLAFGIATLYNRQMIRPDEINCLQLNHMQDVFARLCLGAWGGAFFINHFGQAFRSVSASLCRAPGSGDFLKSSISIFTKLMEPEYQKLFGSTYASNYQQRWFQIHRDEIPHIE